MATSALLFPLESLNVVACVREDGVVDVRRLSSTWRPPEGEV
jgi:hypothetical protein